jgi:hypothetical protein
MRTLIVSIGILAALAVPRVAQADGARFAVIIQGASGDPDYAALHRGWVDALAALMRQKMGLDAAHIIVLAETPKPGELHGTAEDVKATFARLAKDAKPDDLVFVMLIGHGGGDGAAAKFNLVGPDLTVDEWKALMAPITARMVIVDSTSSSFPYLAGLSGKNRIVITATNSFAQKYHTIFPDAFIKAMTAPDADADKNGRISVLEAFNYASKLVVQYYDQTGHLSTEHAVYDDLGDGKGHDATSTTGEAGVIAGLTYLDVVAAPSSADPEVQQLLTRQQALLEQVDALRRRRPSMSADDFDKEFEKLIVDLALVSRDVRRKTGR